MRVTSWIESTAPSEETHSRGSSRSASAWRAYSIDEIGATSISPSSSIRLSSVGTPVTSSTSYSSRWKTGAMLTYEIRPSLIMLLDPSSVALHDGVRKGFQLRPMHSLGEARPRSRSVVEGHLARALERPARGDADEDSLERPAGDRRAHDLVPLGGEEERHRRRPIAEVGARDLPRLDRAAGAVEDVVHDLEGEAEQPPVCSAAAAED